ncbi:MAG: asparagine synthase (glutamine-hydrolyzing) [Candidatus Tectomicrobia bacterium]|nr:asparagine synthase (glutamine-hydrolyzing) [Candidatus Tectomicrobia bacterium]
MCGICGKLVFGRSAEEVTQPLLEAMSGCMAHRGPDGDGVLVRRYPGLSVGLGHRRLSIIDLSEAGSQPMPNEDGTVWVLFNGEIYNFQELRPGLEAKGHRFRSRTDTEVIVHLYEECGESFVEHLRGMFAVAVWDEPRGRLVLARDRLGQKPLFYSESGGRFWFASELNALLEDPDLDRELNLGAVADFLTVAYIPAPASIFRSVRKLPPAHLLLWEKGRCRIERYWSVRREPKWIAPEEEYAEGIRERVEECTRLRLISDVPLGALLSGGIDSSVVVATMARLMDAPVKTFSIGFEVEVFNELQFAREVARRFGTDHHEFIVRPNAVEVLPRLVWHFGEPFGDSSALPTYYLAEMTRRHVTVALNGDAGDEAFGGYERYVATGLGVRLDRLPAALRRTARAVLRALLGNPLHEKGWRRRLRRFSDTLPLPPQERYFRWLSILQKDTRDSLLSEALRESADGDHPLSAGYQRVRDVLGIRDPVERVMALDLETYLPGDLLVKMDITTMAHSLEARSPFLDHKFVEMAASIPTRMKIRRGRTKYILRRAFEGIVPERILGRGKMGFGVPLARWFRGELRPYAREILLDPAALRRGYFREEGLRSLLDDHAAGREDHGFLIWNLLVLELWHRHVLESRERPAAVRAVA